MHKLYHLLPIILISLVGCKQTHDLTTATTEPNLIFQSGFEDDTVIAKNGDADIVGADKSLADHNDWIKDLDNHPNIGNFNIQFEGGDSSMRYARIVAEPGNTENTILKFWLNEPNVGGSKGRIQANLYGNNGLRELYQTVRVFLPADFESVRKYPKKIDWLTIVEFWNNITWSQTVPYRFRITLGIGKPAAMESDLHFILDAQDCELFPDGSQKYTTLWSESNLQVSLPIGKWFTMEYYYKEGNQQNGRFYLAITPEGEPKKVVFDLTKITHNSQDPSPDGVGDFNPLKLYTSGDLINYMKSNNKALQIYWDDFKLWKDKKP
jgi:hypothetical protein